MRPGLILFYSFFCWVLSVSRNRSVNFQFPSWFDYQVQVCRQKPVHFIGKVPRFSEASQGVGVGVFEGGGACVVVDLFGSK